MEELRSRPLFTAVYDAVDQFAPASGGTYLYAASEEERSQHVTGLQARAGGLRYVQLEQVGDFGARAERYAPEIALRSQGSIGDFLAGLGAQTLYLDITGLNHNLWAPLVRMALQGGLALKVVYVEPRSYATSPSPREGEQYELSESKRGIGPLPLFTSLAVRPRDTIGLAALLGFEGARLKYFIEQVQPTKDHLFPIVGMPGFRPEYPIHAVEANGRTLSENGAVQAIRFARANCPFSCYYVLTDILAAHPDLHLKVAMVGTKPHALGAVLRTIVPPTPAIELVYDHVRRKAKRTSGADHCLVYDVSAFSQMIGGI
jgi:hypothetical protein